MTEHAYDLDAMLDTIAQQAADKCADVFYRKMRQVASREMRDELDAHRKAMAEERAQMAQRFKALENKRLDENNRIVPVHPSTALLNACAQLAACQVALDGGKFTKDEARLLTRLEQASAELRTAYRQFQHDNQTQRKPTQ